MVPEAGLEPARGISPADFESAASTNFATLAQKHNQQVNVRCVRSRAPRQQLHALLYLLHPCSRALRGICTLCAASTNFATLA